MKTPDRYTKFREKVPQKAGTYTYAMSMWEPLRGQIYYSIHITTIFVSPELCSLRDYVITHSVCSLNCVQ